jgi:hypothetical protein
VVVLEQSPQSLLASNSSLSTLWCSRIRKQQRVRFTLVIPLAVIMLAEVFQGAVQRAFPEQNEMGKGRFSPSHPSLREGVQIWAARRKSQALFTSGCQGLLELAQNLVSRSCST